MNSKIHFQKHPEWEHTPLKKADLKFYITIEEADMLTYTNLCPKSEMLSVL